MSSIRVWTLPAFLEPATKEYDTGDCETPITLHILYVFWLYTTLTKHPFTSSGKNGCCKYSLRSFLSNWIVRISDKVEVFLSSVSPNAFKVLLNSSFFFYFSFFETDAEDESLDELLELLLLLEVRLSIEQSEHCPSSLELCLAF